MSTHWTRRITFEADANDWVVLRDGLVVGRVMLDDQQGSRLGRYEWAWLLITMPLGRVFEFYAWIIQR